MKNNNGYCECGCGQKTNVYRGIPMRFVLGHNTKRGNKGLEYGKHIKQSGYIVLKRPKHHRATSNGYVYEHILIAEKATGIKLPEGCVIHHVNGNHSDNRPSNLVICQDNAYHMLLHRREVAIRECGHPDWRKCYICKKYSPIKDLYINPANRSASHKECRKHQDNKYYNLKKKVLNADNNRLV